MQLRLHSLEHPNLPLAFWSANTMNGIRAYARLPGGMVVVGASENSFDLALDKFIGEFVQEGKALRPWAESLDGISEVMDDVIQLSPSPRIWFASGNNLPPVGIWFQFEGRDTPGYLACARFVTGVAIRNGRPTATRQEAFESMYNHHDSLNGYRDNMEGFLEILEGRHRDINGF